MEETALFETALSVYEVTDISNSQDERFKYSLINPNNYTHLMSEEYFNEHFRIIKE
jgi:hypothetical protein